MAFNALENIDAMKERKKALEFSSCSVIWSEF